MSTNLHDVFSGQDQVLDKVIIIGADSGNFGGTFTLPAGYQWTDFESVELSGTRDGTRIDGTAVADKELISANPTTWEAISWGGDANNNYYTRLTATSSTGGTIEKNGGMGARTVIGYIKRTASRNLSKIVNVNGGNNIGINQRYEIDIATELGTDYVGRDLIVQAEIYNNSGQGTAGWGVTGWIWTHGTATRGVKASVLNDKIIVQTAPSHLTSLSSECGNPFGISTTISSTTCRVKVWKIDQFITNTAGQTGARGKTVLWSGEAGNNESITFADSLSNYDMIYFESWAYASDLKDSRIYEPSILIGNRAFAHKSASVDIQLRNITETGGLVVMTGTGKFTKVVGINYN